jgi:hypothetical protein
MKLTETMVRVLQAIEKRPGCGANYIADVLWPDTRRHMSLRAGQYVGRLVHLGLVRKTFDEYLGQRGHRIIASVSYDLTPRARAELRLL